MKCLTSVVPVFLVFLCVFHSSSSTTEQEHRLMFETFKNEHNKRYLLEGEEENRFRIFKRNLQVIQLLNQKERGSAKYGVTRFADLTPEEFSKLNGLRPELAANQVEFDRRISVPDVAIPETFDWRDHGVVSEVKDQGFCGSCWAFSVTGNIEGQNAIKNKKLISLSEQELVDCDKRDNGCGGGYMTLAYKSVMEMGGLETETDYPYQGYLSEGCAYNRSLAKVNIDSYVYLPTNETQLAQWLVNHGPISIGINAAAMQFYMRGISHPWKWFCRSSKIDHGVLIVGYGEEVKRGKRLPYWIVKNSWGHSWGRKGYYLVYRGDGTCGVNTMATSAVIGHSRRSVDSTNDL